jgi:hypothetical protein
MNFFEVAYNHLIIGDMVGQKKDPGNPGPEISCNFFFFFSLDLGHE